MRTSAAGDRAGAPARPRSTAIGARLARERRTTGVVVCLGVVLVALLGLADARVEDLAHQLNVSSYAVVAGVDIVFAIAGAIVAYHQPRNAVGWLFLGVALFLALSGLAGDYSTLVYRVHRGSTTLGPIAVLAQPSCAPHCRSCSSRTATCRPDAGAGACGRSSRWPRCGSAAPTRPRRTRSSNTRSA